MTLFTDGQTKRRCRYCGESFRPRVPDQVFCRRWCRHEGKKADGRVARSLWRAAGRPTEQQQLENAN
jgi:hypothetical protein